MPRSGDERGWQRCGGRAAVLVLLLLLTGCTGDARRKDNDPLTGDGPALPARGEARADATIPPRSSIPPLPSPTSAASNAALADGALPSLDPTRDLRIGNRDAGAPTGAWRGPAEGTKTTLNPPQPDPERPRQDQLTSEPKSTPRADVRPASAIQPVSGSSGPGADALLALLQARGVTWHRLETWGDSGEWKYSCSVPNPTNPNIRRTYEARSRDPRSALMAVLTQMDQERR